jgi:hypothetical protein
MEKTTPRDILKDPYVLEFLSLKFRLDTQKPFSNLKINVFSRFLYFLFWRQKVKNILEAADQGHSAYAPASLFKIERRHVTETNISMAFKSSNRLIVNCIAQWHLI